MKRYLVDDDNGRGLESIETLLREHGYAAAGIVESIPDDAALQWESRYRDILENAPIGIFRSTLDGKFVYVNAAMARMLKYESPEALIELVNRTGPAEAVCADPSHWWELLRDARKDCCWHLCEERYRCRDGSIITCSFHYRAVPGKGDSPGEFEGFVEDISERKRAETVLKTCQFIMDKASIGVMRGSADAKILSVNEYWARVLGYTQEELSSMSFYDIDPALTPEFWYAHRERLTATGFDTFETSQRRKDGTLFPVEVTISFLTYEGQELSCSFTQDISRRKQAEESLRWSEEKFRTLAETSAAAIVLYQGERIVYANPAAVRMFGYSEPELLEMLFWDCFHPDFREVARSRGIARQRGEQVPSQYECKVIVKGGGEKWALVTAGRVEFKGAPAGIVTMIDITESKRWQEMNSALLAEKDLLLKEVHHRVKNNLQIISTLLELQSESVRDKEALTSFKESRDRIRAMALIHERLYESDGLASVDFDEYIEHLSLHLFDSYQVDPGRVTLNVAAGGVSIGINKAIPCGLIINELVSNALKHAFPDNRTGEISIRFDVDGDDWISVTVADTGVGMPPGLDFRNTETLGLQLVSMLVAQVRGRIAVDSGPGGTVVSIWLPLSR